MAKITTKNGIRRGIGNLENPILNRRLREVSEAMLNLPTTNAVAVLPNDIFALVIDKFFAGDKDRQTLTIQYKE